MSNVSAKQNLPIEKSAFRQYMRPFLAINSISFRMTPYNIGRAFAEVDNEHHHDFIRAASMMLTYINCKDAEFHDYACGYRDRAIELAADGSAEYLQNLKTAYKVGA